MSTRSISILDKVLDKGNAAVAYLIGGMAFGGGLGSTIGSTPGLVIGAIAGAGLGIWVAYSIEKNERK